MKKIITFFCIIAIPMFIGKTVFAQDIDSLLSNIAKEKNENFRVEMLFNFFFKACGN